MMHALLPSRRFTFLDLHRELGQTFVIVTHNEELANMADRKLTIRDGVI